MVYYPYFRVHDLIGLQDMLLLDFTGEWSKGFFTQVEVLSYVWLELVDCRSIHLSPRLPYNLTSLYLRLTTVFCRYTFGVFQVVLGIRYCLA